MVHEVVPAANLIGDIVGEYLALLGCNCGDTFSHSPNFFELLIIIRHDRLWELRNNL